MLMRIKKEWEPSHNPAESHERLTLPSVVSKFPPEVEGCVVQLSLVLTPMWELLPFQGWVVQSIGLVEPWVCVCPFHGPLKMGGGKGGKEKMGASPSFSFPPLC